MTDLDVQLRQLATDLTTSRLEPPSFHDLPVAAPQREHRPRRGPLLAAAIAVVVLLVIASIAMIRAEIANSSSAPVPPAEQPDTSLTSEPLPPSCVVTAASQEGCALTPEAAKAALGFTVRRAAGIPTGWVKQRQNLRVFTDATPEELRPPGLDSASEYDEIFADPGVDLKAPVSACAPVVLINQAGYDPFAQAAPPGDQVDLGDGHTARGMLGTARCAPEPDAPTADNTFLTWNDRGVWITMSANGISHDAALAIARSLVR